MDHTTLLSAAAPAPPAFREILGTEIGPWQWIDPLRQFATRSNAPLVR
jgi:hypothetical protein